MGRNSWLINQTPKRSAVPTSIRAYCPPVVRCSRKFDKQKGPPGSFVRFQALVLYYRIRYRRIRTPKAHSLFPFVRERRSIKLDDTFSWRPKDIRFGSRVLRRPREIARHTAITPVTIGLRYRRRYFGRDIRTA